MLVLVVLLTRLRLLRPLLMFASKAALRDSSGPSGCLMWDFGWCNTGNDIWGGCCGHSSMLSIVVDSGVDSFDNEAFGSICDGRGEEEEDDMLGW